jgi:hypothetical protein
MATMMLLLSCAAISRAVGRSLRSAAIVGVDVQDQNLQLLLSLTSNCRADPISCGNAADTMANFSDNMTNNVLKGINETQQKFDGFVKDFDSCNLASQESYVSSFDDKVAQHKTCRDSQVAAAKLVTLCEKNVAGAKTNKVSQCESPILTTPIADLDDICKPSAQQPLGEWLESMETQFKSKRIAWQAQQTLCVDAGLAAGNATEECSLIKGNSSAQETSCDEELSAIESFSCARATGSASRCSAYETCYAGVLTKYNTAVAALDRSIEQWKQTWTAGKKMQCTASAISANNVVDAKKMKECNSPNLTDTSFINVRIPPEPVKQVCAKPEIYPGSKMYRSKVYDGLPADVEVRLPTLCLSWKGGCAAYSTFEESAVFLKQNGKYCSVSAEGEMLCGGDKGTFAFKHTDDSHCTGKATLMSLSSGQPVLCRFGRKAPAPKVACDSALSNPPAELLISKNPLATSRSGEVSFEFTPGPIPKRIEVLANSLRVSDLGMFAVFPPATPYGVSVQQATSQFTIPSGWTVVSETDSDFARVRSEVAMGYPWSTSMLAVRRSDGRFRGLKSKGYSGGEQNPMGWIQSPQPSVTRLTSTSGRVLLRRLGQPSADDFNPPPLTFEVEYSNQLSSALP